MMRRWNEEKHVSKNAIILIEFLILFSAIQTTAQIKINDFCYYSNFPTGQNYNKIFVYDFSQDEIPDLVLLNGKEKEVYLHKSEKSVLPESGTDKFFFHSISNMAKFNYKSGSGQLFVFLSREERLAGLLSFTKYGTLQLLNEKNFNSYPDKIIVDDINGDGSNEAIVFGSNFMGYTLLREKNYSLKEEEFLVDKNFSEGLFFDLDYDSIIDLVLYDLLSGNLVFMYNDESGEFFEQRTIPLLRDPDNLRKYDINSDGYDEIVFQTSEGINFFMGDSVSSFIDQRLHKTETVPVDYEIADFNNDRIPDLAVLDENGVLNVSFGVNNDSLSAPVTYMKKDNLVDLSVIRKGKKRILYALSNDGHLYSISNFYTDKKNISISIGADPGAMGCFDYSDSYNKDICFLDDYDLRLKFLLRGNAGEFQTYYDIPLNLNFENISITKNQKPITTFYCYTRGEKLLDRIEVDFSTGNYKKEKFYSYQPLYDLNIKEDKDKQDVQLLLYSDKIATTKNILFEENSVTVERVDTLAHDIYSPALAAGLTNELFFWQIDDSSFSFKSLVLESKKEGVRLYKTLPRDTTSEMHLITKTSFHDEAFNEYPYGVIANGKNNLFYYHSNDKLETKAIAKTTIGLENIRYEDLFLYRSLRSAKESLFLYSPKTLTLYKGGINIKGKDKFLISLFENIYISNYFVAELFLEKVSLVYNNSLEKCITIRRIE